VILRSTTSTPEGRKARLLSRLAFALPSLLLAVALAPSLAWAHAQIATSSPPNGATVAPGLTQIILNFTEDVSPDQSSARLIGTDGSAVPGVVSSVDRGMRTRMTVNTPPLQAGNYTIKWLAVTDDDNAHTNGSINFAVAASGGSTSSSGSVADVNAGTDANGPPHTSPANSTWIVIVGALVVALVLLLVVAAMLRRRARMSGPPVGRTPK